MGFSFAGARPPLAEGHLPLDELATLLGPNDSGKSSLLSCFRQALEAADSDRQVGFNAVFFCELTEAERQFVVAQTLHDRWRTAQQSERTRNDRAWWPLGVWRTDGLDPGSVVGDDAVAGWLEVLSRSLPASESADAWATVLRALADSHILAFESDRGLFGDDQAVWRVAWCLSPMSGLPPDVRDALGATGLRLPAQAGQHHEASDCARSIHLLHLDAPVLVAPIGCTNLNLLPVATPVPTDIEPLRQRLERAVGEMARRARFAIEAREAWVEDAQSLTGQELTRAVDEAWLEVSDDALTATIDSYAMACAAAASDYATSVLPTFVRDRYQVDVFALPPIDSRPGLRSRIELTERGSGRAFSPAHAAEGHRLWMQLALLEAEDVLRRQGVVLDLLATDWDYAVDDHGLGEADELEIPQGLDRESFLAELDAEVRAAEQRWVQAAVDVVSGNLTYHGQRNYDGLVLRLHPADLQPHHRARLEAVRPRLYFIDEPERHLHPRAQRMAAQWLVNTLQARPSQALIATHAVPFLGITEGSRLIYVRRQPGERTHIEPLAVPELDRLTAQALEMGFDRGELLALVSVVLFVEGRADKEVLETLFARELRASGIAVISLHGQSNAAGVVDSEVLLRYTGATAAVWLDNVRPEFVERLRRDHRYRPRRGGRLTEEERTLATLQARASRDERDVEVLPHPGRDIFDLLDPGVISELYPGFPTRHDVARQAAKASGKDWKRFYREQYGLRVSPETCRAIAKEMRSRDAVPDSLRDVIMACELLAMPAE